MKTVADLGLTGLETRGPAAPADLLIEGLCVDSRETKPGYLFAALKGEALDGAEFAPFALPGRAELAARALPRTAGAPLSAAAWNLNAAEDWSL